MLNTIRCSRYSCHWLCHDIGGEVRRAVPRIVVLGSHRLVLSPFYATCRPAFSCLCRQPLQPGDFYYTPEGYLVFTEQYHRRRGFCCGNGCRHCPWRKGKAVNE
jgi:hypothetical protein